MMQNTQAILTLTETLLGLAKADIQSGRPVSQEEIRTINEARVQVEATKKRLGITTQRSSK